MRGLGLEDANRDFLRADSLLAAIVITDEDDSSIEPQLNATEYFAYPPQSTGLHPSVRASIDGYYNRSARRVTEIATSLVGLRRNPQHVVFGALIGIPDGASPQPTALLSLSEMRPRIFLRGVATCPSVAEDCGMCPSALEPACANRGALSELVPVCIAANADVNSLALASPGYRAVGVAQQVEVLGTSSVVGSICSESYLDFFQRVATSIGRHTS